MFEFIVRVLETNKKNKVFNKNYRTGYNKLWIESIRDYHP